jgi:hypothetical protein
MQVTNQIDQLIHRLNELKPSLSNGIDATTEQFNSILKETLESSNSEYTILKKTTTLADQKKSGNIPDWVDPAYGYDTQNPRKPNMREFMAAISGKSSDESYLDPNGDWQSKSQNASALLYGVVGSNQDTRDWSKIMAAKDIIGVAQIETGKMYEPKVDIQTIFNDDGEPLDQIAVLKDKNEKALRVLPNEIPLAEETLRNYGATHASVPANLDDKVISNKFDTGFLSFLKSFDQNPEKLEKLALQTTTENISKRLLDGIPLDEYNKL